MRAVLKRGGLMSAAIMAAALPGKAESPDASTLTKKGAAILQTHCAGCHAIGLTGTSAHLQAPPFREVIKRYPAESLAEALAEGIVSGHADMPVFRFDVPEIDAILTYLDTLNASSSDNP